MNKYICSVCGYPDLGEPPYDKYECARFDICPCCGFEFGYDDYDQTKSKEEKFKEYREKWISKDAPWFSKVKEKPIDWNLRKQLKNINIEI
ncbi:MAG: hypothetical protein WC980_10680 [Candidatus Brocadiia bacterium]